MRVLISGGGTGGHVYPALAVARQLPQAAVRLPAESELKIENGSPKSAPAALAQNHVLPAEHGGGMNATHPVELLWAGSNNGMEQALVERAGVAFYGIDTGKVRGVNALTALTSVGKIISGVRQSLTLLDRFQPDVCFVTGGYVCTPVVIACRLRHVPVLIYLPDMMPGWAIRVLSRLAQRVAVSFPEVAAYFGGEVSKTGGRGKAVVTGYPVRQELVCAAGGGQLDAQAHVQNRAKVRRQLAEQLHMPLVDADESNLPLVLVWGGSQGSRNINQSTWQALAQLLPVAHILHVVGERDWPLLQRWQQAHPLSTELATRYHPVTYLHDEMVLALIAADLTVARAGASSLGEFTTARLPAVLVPLVGVNQWQNADLLAKRGGAVIVADAELKEQLAPTLLALLQDRPKRLAMEMALADLAQPDAARKIAHELLTMQRRFGAHERTD